MHGRRYTHMHIHMHMHIHIHKMYTHVHAYIYIYVYVCICALCIGTCRMHMHMQCTHAHAVYTCTCAIRMHMHYAHAHAIHTCTCKIHMHMRSARTLTCTQTWHVTVCLSYACYPVKCSSSHCVWWLVRKQTHKYAHKYAHRKDGIACCHVLRFWQRGHVAHLGVQCADKPTRVGNTCLGSFTSYGLQRPHLFPRHLEWESSYNYYTTWVQWMLPWCRESWAPLQTGLEKPASAWLKGSYSRRTSCHKLHQIRGLQFLDKSAFEVKALQPH